MSDAIRKSGRASLPLLWATVVAAVVIISPCVAGAAEHVVRIVSDYENLRMTFDPKYLEIEPGDRVTWINEADEEHNVVTFPDGFPQGAKAFQSPIMTKASEQWSHNFEIVGTYEYHCIPHLPMGMHGMIVVGRHSRNSEFHQPLPEEVKAYRTLMLEWFDDDDVETIEREDRVLSGFGPQS